MILISKTLAYTFFCLCLCHLQTFSNVIPFDFDAADLIFKNKNPTIFLLTSSKSGEPNEAKEKEEENWISKFHKTAEQYYEIHPRNSTKDKDLIFAISDTNDGLYTFDKISEHLGVEAKDCPVILFQSESEIKYRFYSKGELETEDLLDFIEKCKSGTNDEFFKSEHLDIAKEGEKKLVKTVVGNNFKEFVLGSDKEVLIIFYAPWDYKSRVWKVQFEKAAESLKDNKNIVFAKINAQKNELPQSYITENNNNPHQIKLSSNNVPMIKFWPKNKREPPITFSPLRNYEMSFDYIIEWLKDHTEYEWVSKRKVDIYAHEEF